MNNNAWFKKENPLLSLHSMGGGAAGTLMQGAKDKTYVDDVFSTYLYAGNDTSRSITNNIDLSTKGGMVWSKRRTGAAENHEVFDTVRGAGNFVRPDATDANLLDTNRLSAFNSDGFSLGTNAAVNGSGEDFTSWTFAKQEGFFDVVTWTGTGSYRTLDHSLGCIPGFIMLKQTSGTEGWICWHRYMGSGSNPHYLKLNENYAMGTDGGGGSNPNASVNSVSSTQFTVGADNNGSGGTWVAYLFAGGESDAATARSVDFDGTGDYLSLGSSSDLAMGTGDFTVEGWFKVNSGSNYAFWMNGPSGLSSNLGVCVWYYYGSSYGLTFNNGSDQTTDVHPPNGEWFHLAYVRSSGTTSLYYNGKLIKSASDTIDYTNQTFVIGGYTSTSYLMDGSVSNFRVVKGTAVYTSSFRPPTEPLTNITNTKLLCCNNSSTTGSTVTPGTITANGDPTASTDSPFDDPNAFKFGADSDQGIVKCGSYLGNSTDNHEIYVGWEPQYWLVKNITDAQNWQLLDSMRGWKSDGNDEYLVPNNNTAEGTFNFGNPTSTGFNLSNASSNWQNESGKTYVYMAIRRPDGYVGKPAEAGTDVFAMDTGAANSFVPNFDSNFPVDYWLMKTPDSSGNWYTGTRSISDEGYTNTNTGWVTQSGRDTDSNVGWGNNSWMNVNYTSWMFKRGQGFDVVSYIGDGVDGRTINHSMNQAPEMIWIKNRTTSGNTGDWMVGHKDLNAGSSPWNYYLVLNKMQAEASDSNPFNNSAPTSTSFELDSWDRVNANGSNYAALLFSSVTGISKVGSYTGTDSNPGPTITTGFQPRFIMIKARNQSGNWVVLDSFRTFDKYSWLNLTNAQENTLDILDVSSTGFTIKQAYTDSNVYDYIYYAHA